jgi:hypothetical protein
MAIHIAMQKFIGTFIAGAAAWPLVPRAQQPERMLRIDVLDVNDCQTGAAHPDPQSQ